MSIIVYLPSPAHWQAWSHKQDKTYRYVTGDLATMAELAEAKAPFIEMSSLLTAQALNQNKNVAWELSQSWTESLTSKIVYAGLDLNHIAKNQMYLPFVTALNATTIWQTLIAKCQPTEITTFGSQQRPVHWIQHFQTDVPLAILRSLAEKHQIPIQELPTPANAEQEVTSEKNRGVLPSSSVNYKEDIANRLLFLGGGRDYRDQTQLVQALDRSGCWSVDHVNIGQMSHLLEGGSPIPWQALQTLPLEDKAFAKILEAAWQQFKEAQRKNDCAYPELFANPHLDFQFEYYIEQLVKITTIIAATNLILDSRPAHGLVLNNDINILRGAVFAAKQRNVPTIELVHGGIAYLEIYDFATDWMIVWGEAQKRELKRFNRDGNRILLGEIIITNGRS